MANTVGRDGEGVNGPTWGWSSTPAAGTGRAFRRRAPRARAPYAHGVVRVTPLAAVILVVGLAAGCSSNGGSEPPADAPSSSTTTGTEDETFQPTDDDREQIQALLKARGAALQDGDRAAFLATIDTQDTAFVRQQKTLFTNLEALPVESVRYSVDDGAGYPTANVKGDDPLFRPAVLEQVRLDVDAAPVTNTLENTFVRRDGTWLLGAESVPGKYHDEHEPQSRPWAGGVAISVARSGQLVMVVDRGRGSRPGARRPDVGIHPVRGRRARHRAVVRRPGRRHHGG